MATASRHGDRKPTWRPQADMATASRHGDRKGRHYYTTAIARFPGMVVATLAVAMSPHEQLSLNSPTIQCQNVI